MSLTDADGAVADADVLALEAVAARAWPAPDVETLGPWLLRAADGWTGRANSALPMDLTPALTSWLPTVEDWYRDRGLRPTLAVPLPTFVDLETELYAAGWEAGHGGNVLVAPCDASLTRATADRGTAVEFVDAPDPAWLAAYHYRGGRLPAIAVSILGAAGARFARLRVAGETAAICRFVVEGPWAGIAAMEVAPRHRRRGFGRTLLRAVAVQAAAAGAERLWLQVDLDNDAAHSLYRSLGFVPHHAYRYLLAPGGGTD